MKNMIGRSPGASVSRGLVIVLLGAASCAPTAPPQVIPPDRTPGTELPHAEETAGRTRWETCYSTFSPAGDAQADLSHLVRDCGPAGGMRALTKVHGGAQAEQDAVDRFTFEVLPGNHCYRVYAAGDRDVKDLDLLLRGPTGNAVASDLTHDSWSALPARDPACLAEPGVYMLEVSVARGSGHYAFQLWGR